jgi:two-component system alkaline phosphatase synthesis response regulator PhoP
MSDKKPVILLIEDEPAMREGIVHNFEFEGMEMRAAVDGPSGLASAKEAGIDLIILDVMLPGMDGFEVLRKLRDGNIKTPILMLTAKGMESDKLEGFKLGADDYVTKPFSILELVARAKALLRRAGSEGKGLERYAFRDIEVDFVSMEVRKDGTVLDFSLKELEMLRLLIDRRGQAVSRPDILQIVWGYDPDSMPTTRTIDTHIARIRNKLGDDEGCDFIQTVHKVGYKFQHA